MADDDDVFGDEPLADGMALSVRLRRDFTVADADRLLAAARRLYVQLDPGADAAEAIEMVTSATDALFVILEHAGLLGDATDGRLAGFAADGLTLGGSQAEIVVNEPFPLRPEHRCAPLGDVFALPPRATP